MKQYVKSIDSLRILSILAVLVIHTTTRVLEAGKYDLAGFPLTIFLNQIARFAVPLFFVISGFVLELNSKEKIDYWNYLKRRFGRVIVPFIFWSLIYYFFVYTNNQDNILKVFLTGNASYQLYFIPTLIIYYLVFPLLHKIYKVISNKWVLGGILVVQLFFLYRDYFIGQFRFSDPIRITILSFFFFIIGMVASHYEDEIHQIVHKWKYILVPGAILSGVYVFLEGFLGFINHGDHLNFYSQWRPSVLVYTLLLAMVLFHLFEKNKLQFKLVEKISKLSFLVFFIHVIVLEITWTLIGKTLFGIVNGNIFGKIILDLTFFGVVSGISFFIAFLLRKIPKLERVTG